jgi:hypothetical protein
LFEASARQVDEWAYERLFKESDLVVIAQPIRSEDSAERTKDNLWKAEFIGVETSFKVLHTVKGAAVKSELTLLHYRTDSLIEDGPSLVSFRTRGISYTISKRLEEGEAEASTERAKIAISGPAEYLLFLKKRSDGRFEPVTGQTDPSFSVKELGAPMIFE